MKKIEKENQILVAKETRELLLNNNLTKDMLSTVTYVSKNLNKLAMVIAFLKTGHYDINDAVADAGVSLSTFYRIRQAATLIEECFDLNDIDYNNTEYAQLIEYAKSIDRSMTNIQKKIKMEIMDRFSGKFVQDGDLIQYEKRASITELIKAAEFFDKKKRQDANTINITANANAEVKQQKVIFKSYDFDFVKDMMENESSCDSLDKTNAIMDQIEEQLKNGEFDE